MPHFKKKDPGVVVAFQYGTHIEAKKFVVRCGIDTKGETFAYPRDLLGTPRDSFTAVAVGEDTFQTIRTGDWVVQSDGKVMVVADGVMQLFFTEE